MTMFAQDRTGSGATGVGGRAARRVAGWWPRSWVRTKLRLAAELAEAARCLDGLVASGGAGRPGTPAAAGNPGTRTGLQPVAPSVCVRWDQGVQNRVGAWPWVSCREEGVA